MNDVSGIGLSLNPDDSLAVVSYLNAVGFKNVSVKNELTRVSNSHQFIELHISGVNNSLSINRFYIKLNTDVEKRSEVIGNSRIDCEGKLAIWYFKIK